eukprot:CAMPEP_0206603548 /NCGR_PEP_ID=MMETSP0325_2-20121206/48523_1 /ASSEMBLY_ACC=CAM_ASM_000347 /TAXON_ID=2866 /ORGANISM="Crypthecodinium cohnii, Strain Seligo" /LENGTH=80 /DNA_ID=CAMNT_0054117197 /DNA_START=72 /DNA_END=312 /DNA_ORIENTATION=+
MSKARWGCALVRPQAYARVQPPFGAAGGPSPCLEAGVAFFLLLALLALEHRQQQPLSSGQDQQDFAVGGEETVRYADSDV